MYIIGGSISFSFTTVVLGLFVVHRYYLFASTCLNNLTSEAFPIIDGQFLTDSGLLSCRTTPRRQRFCQLSSLFSAYLDACPYTLYMYTVIFNGRNNNATVRLFVAFNRNHPILGF